MPTNFDNIPQELKNRNHWVLWKTITRNDKPTKVPFQTNGHEGDSTDPSKWTSYANIVEAYDKGGFEGVGFTFDNLDTYAGVDLDHCINEDGSIKPKAKAILDKLNSYSEISPSCAGVKVFVKAKLPVQIEKDRSIQQGFVSKRPQEGIEIEVYYGARFFTLTGNRLTDYPAAIEDRNDELTEIFKEVFKDRHYFDEKHDKPHDEEKIGEDVAGRLQELMKADSTFKNKYTTPAPIGERSDTDFYLCATLSEAGFNGAEIYQIMTESPQTKWLERDTDNYRHSTIKAGNTKAEESLKPVIRKVSLEDQSGAIGLAEDGTVKQVVADPKDSSKKKLKWVSDCALYINTETSANNATEFTFRGEGAKDHRKVSFTLPVESLERQRFKAALINAFGAKNRVGKLDFETVQRLTRNTRFIRRVEVPAWNDNMPMIPGVGLAKDTEFRLSPMTPAKVFDGDLQVAKDLLRTLFKTHPYASILVATIMGAPAVARWRPDDRIAVALWGITGTQKTTEAKACMTIYGSDYQSDRYLLKHGRAGSTLVAALEVMARVGILPQILDNVKSVDPKDHQMYVSIIHAVEEGSDKQRGKKDGGLRDAQIFRCTPIITGEVRPEEASTDARVLNLSWSGPNLKLLNEIETQAAKMPVVGYHWLRFLAETDLNLLDGFTEARSRKEIEFSRAGHINPGRLATIYTVLMATWELLCESPLGDVFKEATEDFNHSLTRAIQEQGSIVNSDTEVSKFLAGVNELLASQPASFQSSDGKTLLGRVVGKHTDEGLFLLPNEILAELDKLRVFTQKPTVDSIGKALEDAGKLIKAKDGKHRQVGRRVSGKFVRGWLLIPEAFDFDTTPVVAENQQQEAHDTTDPTETTEKERENFRENLNDQKEGSDSKKENEESGGIGGISGISNGVDSDFSDTNVLPLKEMVVSSSSPSVDSIKADLQRAEEERKSKEAHDRELAEKYTKKTDPRHSSCLSCGDPIGPGYSTYFEVFCGSCGPKLVMVRPAVKAHPDGFTLSGLWEDLAARGDRPPRKEYLPGMLQYLGYIEDGSVWRLPNGPASPAEPDSEQVGAEA